MTPPGTGEAGRIRVSLGSAIALNLTSGRLETAPTTLYMLTYNPGKCSANCVFCSQARSSGSGSDRLSRVTWPVYELYEVVKSIRANGGRRFKRICIQTLNYPSVLEDLELILTRIKEASTLPVSVSTQPLDGSSLERLKSLGADRVCIPLDAACEEVFEASKGRSVGGPYSWGRHLSNLTEAIGIFGPGRVTTHLIVGLGETDRDVIQTVQAMSDNGVLTSLFPFHPIKGTLKERDPKPELARYRVLQVACYMISEKMAVATDFQFGDKGEVIGTSLQSSEVTRCMRAGEPFRTYGCKGCNRPYYNEPVSGPIYNYPRKPSPKELEEACRIVLKRLFAS